MKTIQRNNDIWHFCHITTETFLNKERLLLNTQIIEMSFNVIAFKLHFILVKYVYAYNWVLLTTKITVFYKNNCRISIPWETEQKLLASETTNTFE